MEETIGKLRYLAIEREREEENKGSNGANKMAAPSLRERERL